MPNPAPDILWTLQFLRTVCESLVFDSSGLLQRTSLECKAPTAPGAGRDIALVARGMAEEFGLRSWIAYRRRTISVTFERPEVTHAEGVLPDSLRS